RLLEVGAHPRPLEDLREDVRDPLAGDVRAAELGHRVVAVADEDPLVELCRAAALVAVPRRAGRRQRVRELIEEQAAERALVARVAREQGALDRLRKVDQAEDGLVEVREVSGEPCLLGLGERLDGVAHGPGNLAPATAALRAPGRHASRPGVQALLYRS